MKSILKRNRILAVIALIAFISCEKKGSNPLMPFHLFKYRGFTLGLIAMVAWPRLLLLQHLYRPDRCRRSGA